MRSGGLFLQVHDAVAVGIAAGAVRAGAAGVVEAHRHFPAIVEPVGVAVEPRRQVDREHVDHAVGVDAGRQDRRLVGLEDGKRSRVVQRPGRTDPASAAARRRRRRAGRYPTERRGCIRPTYRAGGFRSRRSSHPRSGSLGDPPPVRSGDRSGPRRPRPSRDTARSGSGFGRRGRPDRGRSCRHSPESGCRQSSDAARDPSRSDVVLRIVPPLVE